MPMVISIVVSHAVGGWATRSEVANPKPQMLTETTLPVEGKPEAATSVTQGVLDSLKDGI